MVTGVETAGLVLASFPLVVSGIEAYRNGVKPLVRWWQYRTQVLDLYSAVKSQQIMFQNNIERLLDPIVTSGDQMKRLLNSTNMGNTEWQNPKLAETLKRRLSSSYDPYVETVSRQRKTLEKLEAHLGIVAGVVYAKRIMS
jgi:hypothetical protein